METSQHNIESTLYSINKYKGPKINKRQLILDESFQMIQKEGLQNFSMKRLCQKLDMAQSGIFYYFNNVTTLYSELIKKQIFDETNFLLAQVQITKKPKRAIKRYFFYFIEYYLNRPELFKLVYLNPAFALFDEKTKRDFEEDQETIFAYLDHVCAKVVDIEKVDFSVAIKNLKLHAQSLVSYYFLQASEQSKMNFETLCKQNWKFFARSVFKD